MSYKFGGGAGFSLSRKKIEDAVVPYESVPKLVYLWEAYGSIILGSPRTHIDDSHGPYLKELWNLYVNMCKKMFESPKKVAKIVVQLFKMVVDGTGDSSAILGALDKIIAPSSKRDFEDGREELRKALDPVSGDGEGDTDEGGRRRRRRSRMDI
jgi:hypothetical protein